MFSGVDGGSLARLMSPIVLDLQAPLLRNIAVASTLPLTLVLNFFILGRFPLRAEIITMWCELLLLFLLFFNTFGLSYSFVASKVGSMITQGVFTTVYVSTLSITITFILALLGATARLTSNGFAIAIARFYTSFFRSVPLLIQIYLIYLGNPQLGYVVGAVPAGILALSLCYGAYVTKIFRTGISSIPRGQWASRAIGLTPFQAMTRVILPQSMRLIISPTGNQFISMLKDSSLVSVIGVWELNVPGPPSGPRGIQPPGDADHCRRSVLGAVDHARDRTIAPGKTFRPRPPLIEDSQDESGSHLCWGAGEPGRACPSERGFGTALERLSHKHLQRTLSHYYLELRLARARQLLLRSESQVREIALACGFISPAHFSKCYSRFFGVSPMGERRQVTSVH